MDNEPKFLWFDFDTLRQRSDAMCRSHLKSNLQRPKCEEFEDNGATKFAVAPNWLQILLILALEGLTLRDFDKMCRSQIFIETWSKYFDTLCRSPPKFVAKWPIFWPKCWEFGPTMVPQHPKKHQFCSKFSAFWPLKVWLRGTSTRYVEVKSYRNLIKVLQHIVTLCVEVKS